MSQGGTSSAWPSSSERSRTSGIISAPSYSSSDWSSVLPSYLCRSHRRPTQHRRHRRRTHHAAGCFSTLTMEQPKHRSRSMSLFSTSTAATITTTTYCLHVSSSMMTYTRSGRSEAPNSSYSHAHSLHRPRLYPQRPFRLCMVPPPPRSNRFGSLRHDAGAASNCSFMAHRNHTITALLKACLGAHAPPGVRQGGA